MNFYVVNPIVQVTGGIKKFLSDGTDFDIQPESKDEIADLAEAIQVLISRSR